METYFEEIEALLEKHIGCNPDDDVALEMLWDIQVKHFECECAKVEEMNDEQTL